MSVMSLFALEGKDKILLCYNDHSPLKRRTDILQIHCRLSFLEAWKASYLAVHLYIIQSLGQFKACLISHFTQRIILMEEF